MKDHFKFSESDFWKQMVIKTYHLPTKEIHVGKDKVTLFGAKELANSPFITDGGFAPDSVLKAENLNGITKPVLLKFRSPLSISNEIKHILIKDYFTYLLDLSGGKEEIWKTKVKSKTRNQVRKAQKISYETKFGGTELLNDFYTVISQAWRDLGTPTHSKRFYQNIILEAKLSKKFHAEFIVIYVDKKPASAAILISDGYSVHHPYAATLKKYNSISLNNALYWEIICHAVDNKIQFFDLGRSKNTQGTAIYKKSWGAEEIQLYYYYLNKSEHQNEEENKVVKLMIEIWKKLPVKIANLIGPKIISKVLK